jgi:septal ring factor EnvC (AmiA/AmiB activator)
MTLSQPTPEFGRAQSLVIALFLGVLGLLPFHGQGIASDQGAEIDKYRSRINRLQQSIIQQENRITESRGQERSILEEIEILDKQMKTQQDKLDELALQVLRQEILIDEQEEELSGILQKRKKVEEHLQKRITAYYTMGDIGLINVTFSTKTLPELLSFNDAFAELIKYDRSVIAHYKTTIDSQKRTRDALELEKSMLLDFLNLSVQEKERLEETKQKKKDLLLHVRTQAKLHQQAIQELNEASKQLVDTIVVLKQENKVEDQGFTVNKGSLPPPVEGTIITLFQELKTNKLGISKQSMGIALAVPDGTEIRAVSKGEVVYSGYLRGYGNTIIIHHGYQYYTVTSRIEKLLVSKGDLVKQQEIIGITGDTATLFDEGLYFEIRHGKKSLDPLLWLNPNRLASSHEEKETAAADE